MQQVTFSYARENFARIWDTIADSRQPITLTRRGHENMTLLSTSDYQSLVETLYLLSTPANAERLLRTLAHAQQRQGTPQTLNELTQELGLDTNA